MVFKIPTLGELSETTRQSFRANLPGSDAWLWPNNISVAAKVIAGAVYGNFLWLENIARQRFVTTAEGEFLDRHGAQYGIIRHPPSIATGSLTITGSPELVVPDWSAFSRADGLEYETLADVTLDENGTGKVDVRAAEPGQAYNALAGLSLSSASNLDGLAVVEVHGDGIGLGVDEEEDEPYRSRILFHLRHPPHGGAAHDYVEWTRHINGVSQVFVDPHPTPGTVNVYFLMDDLYDNGVPQQSDVDVVQDYLNKMRPVAAIVTVFAPTPLPIDIQISGLSPDTVQVREAIKMELEDLFEREMRVSTVLEPFTLRRSKIWEAIGQAAGEDHHTLSAPLTDLGVVTGSLPVLGAITYV